MIVQYEYDVFGAVRSETGTSDNPRKFTGKEYESDVKLYYFAARYYDPYIGRFISRDPAGDGVNWYMYGANNPLKYTDPTGTKIVVLDAKGNPEVTFQKGKKNDYHGGNVFTLSNEAGAIYRAIVGTGDVLGTSHPALKKSNIVGQLVQDVIDSDKTVYVTLDPKLGKPGEADFVSGDSDDEIMIRLGGGKNASSAAYGPFLDTRLALVHELVHAHQAITDPATFRNRDYHNVFNLEYEAYDKTAQFAQNLGGHYNKALKYVPEWYLQPKRFNPGSKQYQLFINRKAK